MSVNETISRSILTKALPIMPDFWSAYYLDAYEIPQAFSLESRTLTKPLKIKTNAVKLLQKRLVQKSRPIRDIVTIGLHGEPYVEAEEHYQLTQGLLEGLLEYRYPVHLMTASDLVLRDRELLEEIANKGFLHISVPVLYGHELYSRFYEDKLEESLFLITTLRRLLPDVHISAVVTSILPCLGDDKETLTLMMQRLKRAGVSSVHFSLIDELSPKQTQLLFDMLGDHPDILDALIKRFDLTAEDGIVEAGSIVIDSKQRTKFITLIHKLMDEIKLSKHTPRYLPEDYRYSNYLLAQQLFKRASEKEIQGDSVESIRKIAQKIQCLDHTVNEAYLKDLAQEPSLRRDIDYFLFSGKLRSYGQASLF